MNPDYLSFNSLDLIELINTTRMNDPCSKIYISRLNEIHSIVPGHRRQKREVYDILDTRYSTIVYKHSKYFAVKFTVFIQAIDDSVMKKISLPGLMRGIISNQIIFSLSQIEVVNIVTGRSVSLKNRF